MLASAKISHFANQPFFKPVPLLLDKHEEVLTGSRKSMISKLLIITTGGTIDKIYLDHNNLMA